MPSIPLDKDSSLAAFRRGEETGFNYFFRLHYPALCHFSWQFTRNREASEELVNDVYIKLWERHEKFLDPMAIRSFLYIATRYASLNWIRSQKREHLAMEQVAYLTDPTEKDVQEKLIRAETYTSLHAALNTLPPQCGRIFRMLFLEKKDYQQVADELKLSVSTVRNQKARALMLLRRHYPTLALVFYFFPTLF